MYGARMPRPPRTVRAAYEPPFRRSGKAAGQGELMQTLEMILTLLGGLGGFLIALKIISENLESVAGNKLKNVFNKISSNRCAGIAVGTGVTAVIQSSSAHYRHGGRLRQRGSHDS